MSILKLSTILFTASTLVACGGNSNVKTTSQVDMGIKINALNVQQVTGLSKAGNLDQRALNECPLQTQFPTLLKEAATEKGIVVNNVTNLDTKSKGYNLSVEYTHIFNSGNAFIGHNKYTQVHLALYKDGEKISEADAGRRSGGGFAAGFKGSCSVLGRTLEANANDIAFWLSNPVDGARLGDM